MLHLESLGGVRVPGMGLVATASQEAVEALLSRFYREVPVTVSGTVCAVGCEAPTGDELERVLAVLLRPSASPGIGTSIDPRTALERIQADRERARPLWQACCVAAVEEMLKAHSRGDMETAECYRDYLDTMPQYAGVMAYLARWGLADMRRKPLRQTPKVEEDDQPQKVRIEDLPASTLKLLRQHAHDPKWVNDPATYSRPDSWT